MAKNAKLWGGVFENGNHPEVEIFSVSTHYEDRLVPYDIRGSIAHVRMLGSQAIVSKSEAKKLEIGLKRILKDWQKGNFKLLPKYEDVHGCVEARLKKDLGAVAGKLHSGRSRNDQVALDERLYLRDVCDQLIALTTQAAQAALALAQEAPQAIMPGYTHLQRAQPVMFAHWCLAWVEMLLRDRKRFDQVRASLELCPLGAAALAGSTLKLNRKKVAKELGFKGLTANSLDTVSDRDYLLELAAAMSILTTHLSRLGEEIVLYASQEFNFFGLKDSIATGSSLMPQKRNPDVAELMRAKTGRTHGLLIQLLTVMKGLPLAYNRDMQEDKEVLFSTIDHVVGTLKVVPVLLQGLIPKPDVMEKACRDGYLEATDAAEWLVKKGVPFREAHEATGQAVRYCQQQSKTLSQLRETEWKRFHPSFTKEIQKALRLQNVVNARRTQGGTAEVNVKQALRKASAALRRRV